MDRRLPREEATTNEILQLVLRRRLGDPFPLSGIDLATGGFLSAAPPARLSALHQA